MRLKVSTVRLLRKYGAKVDMSKKQSNTMRLRSLLSALFSLVLATHRAVRSVARVLTRMNVVWLQMLTVDTDMRFPHAYACLCFAYGS